jgi:toxin ParE1/3/4
MKYRVEFSLRAQFDFENLYIDKNVAESKVAARWIVGLKLKIAGLATSPHRCSHAPEAAEFNRSLRHLLYGKRPHVYRVVFEIDEERNIVWLLTIRHGARQPLTLSDIW